MLSGIRAEIALKIYGDDLDTMRNLAETLRARLASVKGLADLQVEKQNRIPQLRVEADYDRARLYGVTPAALTGALEGMSNGRIVSQVVTEGNRRFDVVIRLSDTDRSTSGLAGLLVETPSGHVPLQLVAKIEETDGPNQILRENGQRRIAVYANSDGTRDRAQIVADIRDVLAADAVAAGLQRDARRHLSGLRGGGGPHRHSLARVAASDLPGAAQPLSLGGAGPDHHGQHSAGADRQRRGALDRRIAAVGRQHDGLRHARRHQHPQRHSEDQPLHQSRGPRGRAVRAGARRARQPRSAGAGAAHRLVGGARAHAAPSRRRRAGPGNSPSRSR